MQHGRLLFIPSVPIHPSEDTCIVPVEADTSAAGDYNPEVWLGVLFVL
jgi:hypothetical protein